MLANHVGEADLTHDGYAYLHAARAGCRQHQGHRSARRCYSLIETPLAVLPMDGCLQRKDVTGLEGLQRTELCLTPRNLTRGMDVVRQMRSLKTIGLRDVPKDRCPAEAFWKKHDAGEFKK